MNILHKQFKTKFITALKPKWNFHSWGLHSEGSEYARKTCWISRLDKIYCPPYYDATKKSHQISEWLDFPELVSIIQMLTWATCSGTKRDTPKYWMFRAFLLIFPQLKLLVTSLPSLHSHPSKETIEKSIES